MDVVEKPFETKIIDIYNCKKFDIDRWTFNPEAELNCRKVAKTHMAREVVKKSFNKNMFLVARITVECKRHDIQI